MDSSSLPAEPDTAPAQTPDGEAPKTDGAAPDAPGMDGIDAKDAGLPDSPSGGDGAAERPAQDGESRLDGIKPNDGSSEAGRDGEAPGPDGFSPSGSDGPIVDVARLPDVAPDLRPDTNAPILFKLGGMAFGTGPAYSGNSTATYDKALDGDPKTFFDDSNNAGHVGIAIAGTAVVSLVRFFPRTDYNDRMVGGKFQCSATSQTEGYVDLATVSAVPPLAWSELSIAAAPACRFFRYLGPADSHTNVGEIEFWAMGNPDGGGRVPSDAGAGTTWVNLALGRPASASSEQTSKEKLAIHGNDGLLSTIFCPKDQYFPVWYQVDLGDARYVQQTDITIENVVAAYQYQIDVSLDGSQWVTVAAHLSGASSGRSTLSDDIQVTARYVRVTFTSVSNGYWGCLREFMVWG